MPDNTNIPYAALLTYLADRDRWRGRHGFTPAERRAQFVEGWEAGQAATGEQGKLV